MKIYINEEKFNTCIEPSDWRYAASIVGLQRYLEYFNKDYKITEDAFYFNEEDITEDEYIKFVEDYFKEMMYHIDLKIILSRNEDFTKEQIKVVNKLMNKNSICKKVFKGVLFDGTNKDKILDLIEENRFILTKETYKNGLGMYCNFANKSCFFNEAGPSCRLTGYYIDWGKKGRSASYQFDKKTFIENDDSIFDFVPIGFSGDPKNSNSFFINDSFLVENLINTNRNFKKYLQNELYKEEKTAKDAREVLFKSISKVSDFLNYDVEIIRKRRDDAHNFYETMFLRSDSINVLKNIKDFKVFCCYFMVTEDYFYCVHENVIDCIVNLHRTDPIIEFALKDSCKKDEETGMQRPTHSYLIGQLINVNILLSGGEEKLRTSNKCAFKCAKTVSEKIEKNKLNGFRNQLINAITTRNYEGFCNILLNLSNYADVYFGFAFDLFEDFEKNKDIAYTFINALNKDEDKKEKESKDAQNTNTQEG